jgi:hypothetical protein
MTLVPWWLGCKLYIFGNAEILLINFLEEKKLIGKGK